MRIQVVEPLNGYTPQAGAWLWAFEDSRQRTLKVVRVRISHKCADGGDIINKGDFAVVEQAIIDNEWKRCYVCFGCIKRNAIDVNGYTEEEFKNLK